jgi:NRAMP (natural resistance-associated macrophage protein)-like metal ion transporter
VEDEARSSSASASGSRRPRRRLAERSRLGAVRRFRGRLSSGPVARVRGRLRRWRLFAFLGVLGPGLIAGIVGNDAGGITTYAVLGAETGYLLLWLFPITIVILAVVQEMAARLGVVTGQGLSDLIRDRFGVRWTLFAMLVLLVANVANTVAEFAGASAATEIFGVSRLITVPVAAAAIWALVIFASYRALERIFLSISLVFLTYVIAAFVARPDWAEVGRAFLSPSLDVPGMALPTTLLLAVAVVGTTITPYMQFYLQSAVAEKGIDEEELRLEQADAVTGSLWTNVVAIFIVVATASTLYGSGIALETASQAAEALRPVAGDLSTTLFAVGLFGASVLAATIMPISTAFVICEAFGWESGVGKPFRDAPAFFLIYSFVLFAGAAIMLLPGLDLIGLIVASQNLQGLLLPVVLIFLFLLVNDRRLLGAHVNGRRRNIVTAVCIGLVILLDVALLGSAALDAIGIPLD